MFDHVSLGVADLERAAKFYDAALAPLGLIRLLTHARAVGYGPPGYVGETPFALVSNAEANAGRGTHVAFAARDRAAVDAFHRAALEHAGTDDGPPGVREHYDSGYYAAFVKDPDGHKLEAVVHESAK